jgi:hypothetical protein
MSFFQHTSVKQALVATAFGLLALTMAACGTTGSTPASTSSSTSNSSLSSQVDKMPKAYTFTTLNDQADPTFNQLLGINDDGVIAGYFGSGAAGHPNKGYTLSKPYHQQNYSSENFPGSVQTQVTAINNHGQTAGFWVDANGNNFGFIKWEGRFTSYTDPNTGAGTVNQLLGLNDNGIAVGFYTDANGVNHAYKLDRHSGKFTAIVPPDSTSAVATGITDKGDITGFLTLANGNTLGFLLRGKTFTEFSFPGSTNTTPFGLNQYDQIVGVYVDGAGKMHGFLVSKVWDQKIFQSIDDPNGVGTTTVNGLNDKGQLVGFYVDADGNTDGFLANPQSDSHR